MTFEDEPARWADGDDDALVLRLMRAGQVDAPTAQALRAAPAAIAALVSSSVASAALAQGAVSAGAAGPSAFSPLVLVKWIAVGTVASTSMLALVHAPEPLHPPRAPAARPAEVLKKPDELSAPRAAPSASVAPSPGPAVTNAPSARRADVAREVALLDAARTALVASDAGKALRLLDSADQLPTRALVPEATVLRVRALLAQGKRAEARRVADSFVASAPNAPQAAVLRSILENGVIQSRPSPL
jgi:hypothetical protein